MTKRQKKTLYRILIGAALYAIGSILPTPQIITLALFLASYLIVGGDVLLGAIRNISKGQVFDENFLMSIATIGAFAVGEYPEGVAVMLFYQVGELFQSYAVNRSRKSISELMDIRPDYANIERDNELVQVDPEEVAIGDIIVIKPGEKVPLDGIVIEGETALDTKALTGETIPREITKGSEILSGCINLHGMVKVQVTKAFAESTVAKILDLVENASNKKSKQENFITKFAKYYTPCVVIAAVFLAFIPPLVLKDALFSDWIHRALIFLVISCPCALVISIPLSFFGGIGGASKAGILVKGSNYLEALAETEIIVFDKTGTLTKGTFKVTKIQPVNVSEETLLEYTALAESYSDHPISKSIKTAYNKNLDQSRVESTTETPGYGVSAVVDGKEILVGNQKLMDQHEIKSLEAPNIGTILHVAIDGSYEGYIVISDELKEDAKSAISKIRKSKVRKLVMLTGDNKAIGEYVANELGLDEVYAELLPGDKVDKMEHLLKQTSPNGKLAFVGDGINDAPVLTRADIGIAMGGLGSDAAIEAADIVLMTDEPSKISTAIAISKKTLTIAKQNIIFALGVKAIVLLLGAFGIANMWEAVFADVGVSVIAILNAMRALNIKNIEE